MKESVLQYVWQHKLFVPHGMVTTTGHPVKVIDVGRLNTDGGPDFFNAKVQIGATIWAGNVEIHIFASDWYRHNHHTDDTYASVILHVVLKADQEVYINGRRRLPQLELKFPETIEKRFEELLHSHKWLPCVEHLQQVKALQWESWKNALLYERLSQKIDDIRDLLLKTNFHFEEVFFRMLARGFGFSVNSAAFEILSASVPWPVVQKCRSSVLQMEALLLGQSGLLFKACHKYPEDEYLQELAVEYRFLQRKFDLVPMPASLWRWLRLRPENFPEIRIAQLAAMMVENVSLFSDLTETIAFGPWIELLGKAEVSTYWKHHLIAGVYQSKERSKPGEGSLICLIINAVVPVVFSYADYQGDFSMKEKVLELVEQLPAENNVIIRNWIKAGADVHSAVDTQALIQLYRKYCEPKNCLRCRIGHIVLTSG